MKECKLSLLHIEETFGATVMVFPIATMLPRDKQDRRSAVLLAGSMWDSLLPKA